MENTKLKLLFVCSGGIQRSPTFAKWFNKNDENTISQSCGIWNNPGINDKLYKEADLIFVMDLSHALWFQKFKPEHLRKIYIVGVSDEYNPDEEDLLELINYWHKFYFPKIVDNMEKRKRSNYFYG